MLRQTERMFGRLLQISGWDVLLLIVAVCVLFGLVVWIRSWFRDREDTEAVTHRMLTQFGDLHREGDLTEEEYRSIKQQLIRRLDDSQRATPDSS